MFNFIRFTLYGCIAYDLIENVAAIQTPIVSRGNKLTHYENELTTTNKWNALTYNLYGTI